MEQTKPGPPKPPAKIKTDELSTKVFNLSNPQQLAEFADLLNRYVKTNGLTTKISGKEYVNVDGWKFAAISFGLTSIPHKPVRLDQGKLVYNLFESYYEPGRTPQDKPILKERIFYSGTDESVVESIKKKLGDKVTRVLLTEHFAYECEADVFNIKTGQKISYGAAICSNAETKKATFDQYAIQAMAQTRAIGRSVKNLLGFIMNAAGFENTPAEEMEGDQYNRKEEPKEGTEQTARVVPEGGLDYSTQLEIEGLTTREELSFFWDKNPHLHGNKTFVDAMGKQKLKVDSARKTPPGK